MEIVKLSTLKEVQTFSTEVKKFIHENKLWSNVQGRPYVNVEGWQFMGGMMGITTAVKNLENLSTDKEIKYRAEVELHKNGQMISSGVAICSNKESGKTGFAEYAIASMCQTRAIGKAYRIYLGWIMKMAGFESTPLEEMQYESPVERKEEIVNAYSAQRRAEK